MLTVSRKQVQNLYNYHKSRGHHLAGESLIKLFGSKCLPDNVDILSQNPPENCDNGNLISTDDNKPAGPKYHKGEKVCYNGYVYEIEGLVGKNRYALKGLNFDLVEDMIDPYEPYTEPEEPYSESLHTEYVEKQRIASEESHLRNLSQETASCDKHFDAILKDGFRNERRLNIASQMTSAYISSEGMTDPSLIATIAFQLADALIAEGEKGGVK